MYDGQIYIVLTVIFIVLAMLIGIGIGFLVGKQNTATPVGTFIVNHTDPTKDLCTLHLDVDLDVIEGSKAISFKVAIIDDKEESNHETEN